MKRIALYIVFLICICGSVSIAQEAVSVKVKNDTLKAANDSVKVPKVKKLKTQKFKDEKRLDAETSKLITKGDNYVLYGQKDYAKALVYYLEAEKHMPNNADLNLKIAECYLQTSKNPYHCINYLEKAYHLNKNVDKRIHLELGKAYHLNENFDEAIAEFEKYKKHLAHDHVNELAEVNKRIRECESAKKLTKNPVRVFIDNIGDSINTPFPEYGPYVTIDEDMMFFTSRRDNTTGGGVSPIDYKYYEDIYVSHNIDGVWSSPTNLGRRVNSRNNDATIGISVDGQKLFIYRDAHGGDIYLSNLEGDVWSKPSKMTKKFNTKSHESSAAFSYNMRTIYFISDKLDSNAYGGKDIYVADIKRGNRWNKAVNIGSVINTPYDENSVYAHPDGKTLYFSSKGHNSMGGYDIFKSTLVDGKWTTPENVGYPINTVGDEVSFVLTANGKRAYFASSENDGKGDKDIYVVTFLGPEKEGILSNENNLLANTDKPVSEKVIEPLVEIKENQLTILKGVISDAITKIPLEATIEIFDNETQDTIATFKSNSKTGKYLVSLPSGRNYGISVKAPSYLFYSDNFIIPATSSYQVIYKDVELNMLDVGSSIVLKNIFFDFDKATLKNESHSELGRIVKLLNDFPYLTVEIAGHTDDVGSEAYNHKLSQNRSKSVIDYLIANGIEKERVAFKGYGLTQPIASNDTEEGRQQNRRTEFKIISKDFASALTPKKAVKAPKVPKQPKEAKPAKQPKEAKSKEPKTSKPKEAKIAKEPHKDKVAKVSKKPKEIKDPKQKKKAKDPKGPKPVKEPKRVKKDKRIKEPKANKAK